MLIQTGIPPNCFSKKISQSFLLDLGNIGKLMKINENVWVCCTWHLSGKIVSVEIIDLLFLVKFKFISTTNIMKKIVLVILITSTHNKNLKQYKKQI